ncbi:MAG: DUF402 domain-containing protein [Pyrinomonadaceae bacterium]|nr:DUF402 domain-containing protein [Pyrinomonadaceae bacterium]
MINSKPQVYTIQSKKYDGTLNRSWKCELVERKDSLYILQGTFDQEVNHRQIGVIRRATVSIEYFWIDRWFNIFKFISPDGKLLGHYCNISQPPHIFDSTLCFVDLDLDIFVDINLNIKILDEDEFAINCVKYKYPETIINKAKQTLGELIEMIEKKRFPFGVTL